MFCRKDTRYEEETPVRSKKPLIGLLAVVLALTVLGLGPAPAVQAADIRIDVTSTADLPDGKPGDGKCNNTGLFNTGCSLRAAIMEANAQATTSRTSRHVINVPNGTYVLTRNGARENLGATGDLDVRRNMAIRATGSRIIIRGESGWDDRIFDIQETATVELRLLDIRAGNTIGSAGTLDELGGGVLVAPDASLTLRDTVVRGNRAVRGGGMAVREFGALILNNSTVRINVAENGGGGIWTAGTLTATSGNNGVDDNTAEGGDGGGILIESGGTASLGGSIRDNRVLGHDDRGGGIHNEGTLKFTGGFINGNPTQPSARLAGNAAQLGGGLSNEGTATLRGVTIEGNRAAVLSSAPGATFGGGLDNRGQLTVDLSAIVNNTAEAAGGAVFSSGALTMTNTTISGNTAGRITAPPPGSSVPSVIGGFGGGLVASGDADLNNATIANNRAGDRGGGIAGTAEVRSTMVRNTIIGDNTAPQGPDCSTVSSTADIPLVSGGFNLIENPSDCTISGDLADNITGRDPRLTALGLDRSHRLLSDSPAIDAGSPDAVGTGGSACERLDQVFDSRPRDGDGDGVFRCDIGAVEMPTQDPDDPIMLGSASLTPPEIATRAGEPVTMALTWTVPAPRVWSDLRIVDLRLRDGETTALWLRFDQDSGTLDIARLSGAFGPGKPPGRPGVLETPWAAVQLEESAVEGSGPAGTSVTLWLSVTFKPRAAGHIFQAEAAATGDSGRSQGFAPVGAVRVE